jgi:hypothetical protein
MQYGVGIRNIFARRGDDRDLHEYSETAHLSRAPYRALLFAMLILLGLTLLDAASDLRAMQSDAKRATSIPPNSCT